MGRLYLKDSGIYLVLRELHKWEKNASAKQACQNLVEILIADEPAPGMDNLRDVEIPADVVRQLEQEKMEQACEASETAVVPISS